MNRTTSRLNSVAALRSVLERRRKLPRMAISDINAAPSQATRGRIPLDLFTTSTGKMWADGPSL
jgi:hypothetical protein